MRSEGGEKMGLSSSEITLFVQYMQRFNMIKIEKCDIEKQCIEMSISYEFELQFDFICKIYNKEKKEDKVYINIKGIGKVKELTLETLEKINDVNDFSGSKIYMDENNNLILAESVTTQMTGEEKYEWIFRMIVAALMRATLAREDLYQYIC